MPATSGLWLVLPTYNEAENVEAIVEAVERAAAGRAPDPDRRRRLAGRHRADRRPPRRPSATTSRSCTGRARRASGPPTSPASAPRSPAARELVAQMDADFSHDPDDLPRLLAAARGRRPGARLALRGRRRGRRVGADAAADQPRRVGVRARAARGRDPRPDRRVQGLSPRACSRRSSSRRCSRSATRFRSRPRTARCAPAFAWSRCRSCFATAGSVSRR